MNHNTRVCEDDDECALGIHDCDQLGPGYACRNTQGSFRCEKKRCSTGQVLDDNGQCKDVQCQPGYELDDSGNCVDINECEDSVTGPCFSSTEDCQNTPGSYKCISRCLTGMELNPVTQSCQDIDECEVGLYSCFGGRECINTYGSYRCDCPNGFEVSKK